ncbi:unnamed protein product [Moneuplotes crassus]|uniref:Uncharacterized protein n=1 Tax=Euplotes crassus TaxID=5936 RepID=A0AAD1XGB0_EUPCR|nr:unnamed protein product [Moneuplotes crassus]
MFTYKKGDEPISREKDYFPSFFDAKFEVQQFQKMGRNLPLNNTSTPKPNYAPLPPLPKMTPSTSTMSKRVESKKGLSNTTNKIPNKNQRYRTPEQIDSIKRDNMTLSGGQYSFQTSTSQSSIASKGPAFSSSVNSYSRLFRNSFSKSLKLDLRSLKSLKKEDQFKQYLAEADVEDKTNKYFYSKFADIYDNEKRRRFNKKFKHDQAACDRYEYLLEVKRNRKISQVKNTFVGTKNRLVDLSIKALREKIDSEKEDRKKAFTHYLNDVAKKKVKRMKIQRIQRNVFEKRRERKHQFIIRGKSFIMRTRPD